MSAVASLEGDDLHAVVADLHRRYARRIQQFCRHQLGNWDEAEDATQLTFINALRGLERGASLEQESAWLFTIARNVCLNSKRSTFRRRRVETTSTLEEYASHSPPERESLDLSDLAEALRALPAPQRRAVLLREWQGFSYTEIAADLAVSQSAVETLLFRARRTLAAHLAGDGNRGRRARGTDLASLAVALKGLLVGATPKLAVTAATIVAASVCASVEPSIAEPSVATAAPAGLHVAPQHPGSPASLIARDAADGRRVLSALGSPSLAQPGDDEAPFASPTVIPRSSSTGTVAATEAVLDDSFAGVPADEPQPDDLPTFDAQPSSPAEAASEIAATTTAVSDPANEAISPATAQAPMTPMDPAEAPAANAATMDPPLQPSDDATAPPSTEAPALPSAESSAALPASSLAGADSPKPTTAQSAARPTGGAADNTTGPEGRSPAAAYGQSASSAAANGAAQPPRDGSDVARAESPARGSAAVAIAGKPGPAAFASAGAAATTTAGLPTVSAAGGIAAATGARPGPADTSARAEQPGATLVDAPPAAADPDDDWPPFVAEPGPAAPDPPPPADASVAAPAGLGRPAVTATSVPLPAGFRASSRDEAAA